MKRFDKIQTLLLMVMSICLMCFVGNVKADNQILTVDSYKTYLQEVDNKAYSQYTSLSLKEQQQVVDTLLNPKLYENANNWKKTDFIITDRAGSTKNAWGARTFSIAGFAILEYKVNVTYRVEGNKPKEVYSSDAYVSRNLNPLLQTSLLEKNVWIDNNLVRLTAVFSYDAGPIKDLSIRIGTFHALFSANGYGNVVHNYWYSV